MFDTTYVSDSISMSTPLSPYIPGDDDFFDAASCPSGFRQQRLGNYLLSDLFTAGYMTESDFVKDKLLANLARDKTLSYTGETFDQWDLDVLIYCVMNTTFSKGRVEQIQIEPGKLLRTMNLRNSETNRARVYSSLFRLHTGSLLIEGRGYRYMTRIIDRALLDQQKEVCLVEVNGDVMNSLRCEKNLAMDIQNRNCFKRNGLAKWLHGAIIVFKGGFVADIDCLHSLCGGHPRMRRAFPVRLNKALDVMIDCGVLDSWDTESNKVMVVPSFMQRNDTACGFISSGLV